MARFSTASVSDRGLQWTFRFHRVPSARTLWLHLGQLVSTSGAGGACGCLADRTRTAFAHTQGRCDIAEPNAIESRQDVARVVEGGPLLLPGFLRCPVAPLCACALCLSLDRVRCCSTELRGGEQAGSLDLGSAGAAVGATGRD